mgnify:CR=1 FL=1
MKKIKYIPELHLLRSLAILLVVLYHLEIHILNTGYFRSGYLGVDIFFVISGFLIGRIIIYEKFKKKFSIINFLKRRFLRIFPALFFTVLISLLITSFYFVSESAKQVFYTSITSFFFISNFFFLKKNIEYGNDIGFENPLLHTWSLSIEGQFYLLLPFLFFFKNRVVLILIISFLCLSLFYFLLSNVNLFNELFYLIFSRFWQFLSGVLVAYIKINNLFLYNRKSKILFYFLLILIIFLSINFNLNTDNYKILNILITISSATLIFLFNGKIKNYFFLLPLNFIGSISYSLYLTHYPMLLFFKDIGFFNSNIILKIFVFIILLLSLSFLMFRYVERYYLNSKNFGNHLHIFIFFSCSIILLVLYLIHYNPFYKNFKERFNIVSTTITNQALKNNIGESCYGDDIYRCEFIDDNFKNNKTIFLVGDSSIASISKVFKEKLNTKKYDLVTFMLPGCYFFKNYDRIIHSDKNLCNKNYADKIIEEINLKSNSIIIIGGRTPLYLTNLLFDNFEGGREAENLYYKNFTTDLKNYSLRNSFYDSINAIKPRNDIILIYPIPEVGWNVPEIFYKKNFLNILFKRELSIISTSYERFKERTKEAFKLLDGIDQDSNGQKNIYRFYPHEIFCNSDLSNRCVATSKEVIFYSDDDHLSFDGARLFSNKLIELINKIN